MSINLENVRIQITKNISLSVEGYVEFSATKKWWEKEKTHDCGSLHWSGNEYFIPVLVEYYREEQSLEAKNLKEWCLSHSWGFDKWGEQYHLVYLVEATEPSVLVEDPETGEIIGNYKFPSVRWEVIRDFCLPVAINFK